MTDADTVLTAFLQVRDGRSPEYVLCDDDLNEAFLSLCRTADSSAGPDEERWNMGLLNLRKAALLTDYPTTVRKCPSPASRGYSTCIAQVVRLMERQFGANVYRIICNRTRRCQFDALVRFLLPQANTFDSRYRALTLRKTRQLRPEPVGQIIAPVASAMLALSSLEEHLGEIPDTSGVYIFFDACSTLYVGKADNLKQRIRDHVGTWTYRDLASAVNAGKRGPVWLTFIALPLSCTARELAAYELELIHSRQPEHNRAGLAPRNRE